MYLVTGATGHVGGPVARQLHEQGHHVRAFVRDPPEIAAELFVSPNTIKSQAYSLFRKLGVSSRSQAVARSRELALLEG